MPGTTCGRDCRRKGSATMELAIMLPVLITAAVLAMDFGRFAHSWIAATNAARAGAYMGAANPPDLTEVLWDAAIQQAIVNELSSNAWYDPNELTVVNPSNTIPSPGVRLVRVEITYTFQTLMNWSYLTGYSNVRQVRRIVVMRAIR